MLPRESEMIPRDPPLPDDKYGRIVLLLDLILWRSKLINLSFEVAIFPQLNYEQKLVP